MNRILRLILLTLLLVSPVRVFAVTEQTTTPTPVPTTRAVTPTPTEHAETPTPTLMAELTAEEAHRISELTNESVATRTPTPGCVKTSVQCVKAPCPVVTVCPRPSEAKRATTEQALEQQLKQKKLEELKVRRQFEEQVRAKKLEAAKKFEAAKAANKQKMAEIKDAKKKEIVNRVTEKMQTLSTKRLDIFTEQLAKMGTILDTLTDKQTAQSAATGANERTTRVNSAIAAARTAIEKARTAVTNQAAKSYTVTITTEANLGTDVRKSISSVEFDLKAVNETVKVARSAVSLAVKEYLGEGATE